MKQFPKLPDHWKQRKLRHVTNLIVSNVDKHTHDDEEVVRLCNYVDVYRNEFITASLPFMRATAAFDEIEQFRLKLDDVIITKDSELWSDIGEPALVRYAAEDLICGYHLAILRPRHSHLSGEYLLRCLQIPYVAVQLHVAANGITRYGLSQTAIKDCQIPLPPLAEQEAIVRFIRYLNHRVNRLIKAKRRLIALLNEQKQAIIHHAVTRGLDPAVPLKPSGVDWLGEIPQHWTVKRAKELFREIDSRSATGTELLLSLRMYQGLVPHNEVSKVPILPSSLVNFKRVLPGQMVMNRMRAAIGMFGVATQSGLVSPDYAVLQPGVHVCAEYFLNLFKTRAAGNVFRMESKGLGTGSAGFMRLYTDRFGIIKFAIPPHPEQIAIAEYIKIQTADMASAEGRIKKEIDLIREYRTRLVSDVVTGQLDVRHLDLPDIEDEPVGLAGEGDDFDELSGDDGGLAGEELAEAAL